MKSLEGASAQSTAPGESHRDKPLQHRISLPSGVDVSRGELVRIMAQALRELGYDRSSETLQNESGIKIEEGIVMRFRDALLSGQWSLVDELMPNLDFIDEQSIKKAQFMVMRQKFLEMLERGLFSGAMECLRNNISADIDLTTLRKLSSLVMFSDKEELRKEAQWDGAEGESRKILLKALQANIQPTSFLPNSRLLQLVDDALANQISHCKFHNTRSQHLSLLKTHICSSSSLPRHCSQVIDSHGNEVWYVDFSHDGNRLASASKDMTVIIWRIEGDKATLQHRLRGHTAAVSYLSWSPDDKYLLACGSSSEVKLWETSSGDCVCLVSAHTDSVMACAFTPDSKHFVTGALDNQIIFWNLQGNRLYTMQSAMVNDLAIVQNRLVVISTDSNIHVYDLKQKKLLYSLSESRPSTSFSLSRDGRFALVNLSKPAEIHLWDLDEKRIVRKFYGLKQDRYIVRSTLGGVDEGFVASGSEDCEVYMWDRNSGELVGVVHGHGGPVNSVAWNQRRPGLLASCSDDRTIRLWSTTQPAP